MKVYVNGEPREVEDGITVKGLLEHLRIEPAGIAVEINREIVPRGTHGKRTINEGDRIEIVRMVGGG